MQDIESKFSDVPAVAIQVSRDVVVASIQIDLVDAVLARFREDLLQRVYESASHAVILDLSGLETLDAEEFSGLRRVISSCEIMGSDVVLVGLRPGVVSSLIETGADIDGLCSAIDLDAAYALLEPAPVAEADIVSVAEVDPLHDTTIESGEFAAAEKAAEDER